MASAVKQTRTEREESCFSRAARGIRRALSRICGDCCRSSTDSADIPAHSQTDDEDFQRQPLTGGPPVPVPGCIQPDRDDGLHRPPSKGSRISLYDSLSALDFRELRKRTAGSPNAGRQKIHKVDSSASPTESYMLCQPAPDTLTGRSSTAGSTPGLSLDDTRETDLHVTAGPSTDDDSNACYPREKESSSGNWFGRTDRETREYEKINRPPPLSDPCLHLPSRKDTDDGGTPPCIQSITQTVAAPPCLRGKPTFIQDSTGENAAQDAFESVQSDSDTQVEMDVTAVNSSVTNALPAHPHLQNVSSDPRRSIGDSSCLPRSQSMPSLSQTASAKTCTGAGSLPDMLLKTSFEEFTPDDENDETYRFQCSGPGLYQCSVTGLVFHMEGEGVVVYRTVPWNRRLLAPRHKRPAGPLFDIKCVQQSVCRLHLPHCEIRSTGGADFLSVAHVSDEGVEFISPHEITETHVIINITGFSGYGNVKDEDSPAVPVRALVLLFYRPPTDPDPESLLTVLLLPRNVVLRDVLRFRKKLVADDIYIDTSPHCKLQPNQEYTLSTCPEDDSILVQPTEAEFDCDNYDNYFPSFQVTWETMMKHMKLLLGDTSSSRTVWERRVCLSSAGGRRSASNLPPGKMLLDIRSSFVESISGPVLNSLQDKLLERKVITDPERESADVIQNNRDKARHVIDTVRKKGEAACSEMTEFLREADPFLCEHLGLM